MDPHFEKKLDFLRKPMLWLMIENFNNYRVNGISKPKVVEEYTRKYWEENDPYKLFISENLIKTDNNGDKIRFTDIHKQFKIWYQMMYPSNRNSIPKSPVLLRQLESDRFLGKSTSKIWSGWRVHKPEAEARNPTHNID